RERAAQRDPRPGPRRPLRPEVERAEARVDARRAPARRRAVARAGDLPGRGAVVVEPEPVAPRVAALRALRRDSRPVRHRELRGPRAAPVAQADLAAGAAGGRPLVAAR